MKKLNLQETEHIKATTVERERDANIVWQEALLLQIGEGLEIDEMEWTLKSAPRSYFKAQSKKRGLHFIVRKRQMPPGWYIIRDK